MGSPASFMKKAWVLFGLGLFISGFSLAQEQGATAAATESAKWRKKPVFMLKLGGFFPQMSTNLGIDGGDEIDVENDLGLARNASVFRLDGDVRIASWFGLDLLYYGLGRSKEQVLDKDIRIGDTIFPVHQTVQSSLKGTYASADLKFYFLHRPRLDFGAYVGLYLTHLKFQVKAQEIDRQLLEIRKFWAPVPSIGLHFWYQPIRNMFLYAKGGLFTLKPSQRTKFESATLSINLDYYYYKFLGIGARYEYNHGNLDLDVASYHGNINYDLSGAQVYLVLGF